MCTIQLSFSTFFQRWLMGTGVGDLYEACQPYSVGQTSQTLFKLWSYTSCLLGIRDIADLDRIDAICLKITLILLMSLIDIMPYFRHINIKMMHFCEQILFLMKIHQENSSVRMSHGAILPIHW